MDTPKLQTRQPYVIFCICTSLISCFGFAQNKAADLLMSQGRSLHENAYYDSAIAVFKRAREVYIDTDKIEGVIEADYARTESLTNLGKCDLADSIIQSAITQSINTFGESSAQAAKGYYYYARMLGGCARKFSQAIESNSKSLEIKSKIYGNESIEVALNLSMMGYYYNAKSKHDSALINLNKAIEIWKKKDATGTIEYSHNLSFLSKAYANKGELKKALDLSAQSLKIRKKILRSDHPTISNSLTDIGDIYKRFGNYDEALAHYLPALEIRKQSLGEKHPNVGASYYTIGNLHGSMFNYRRAIDYIKQGNLIIEEKFGESLPVLHTYYAYLGKLYGKVGADSEAIQLLSKAQRLAETYLEENHPYLGIIYNIIGQYYSDYDSIEAQIGYLKKAQKIYQINYGKNHPREADVLTQLGEVSVKQGNFGQATQDYNQALSIVTKKSGNWNAEAGGIYQYKGDMNIALGEYSKARECLLKSIRAFSIDTTQHQSAYHIDQLTHPHAALRSIHRLADSYVAQFEQSGDITHLTHAAKYYSSAVSLAGQISADYQMEVSKAQLAKETRSIFKDAIEASYKLYERTGDYQYKTQIFEWMERSKAPILLEAVVDSEAKRFSYVPDSLLAIERNMKIELTYFKKELRDAKRSDNIDLVSVREEDVFKTQQAIEGFKDKLKELYPDYFAFKYDNSVIGVEGVLRHLSTNTLMIEYFEGSSDYFIVSIGDNHFEISRIPNVDLIQMLSDGYIKSLTDSELIVTKPQAADSIYETTASLLYDKLLLPALSHDNDYGKLIIIPDGKLTQVNFGIFLSKKPKVKLNYQALEYVLRDYSISYGYSATLNFRSSRNSSKRLFGGFAPSYSSVAYTNIDSTSHPLAYQLVRSGNLPLPGAISEVTTISEFFGGRAWTATEATESNFKLNAANFRILHLAMHSLLNSEDPEYSELLFNAENDTVNDGYLTIDEIYNLELNAEMTVLSACSSGSGEMQLGEGPISFTRAFSYAGCPSVIMSMWKLPDAATKEIMISFYQNIDNGMEKDEALRNAQIGYLSNTNDPLYQHPFFWGSFVAMGDTRPVSPEFSYTKLIILISGLVFLVGVVLLRRKSKQAIQEPL